MRRVRESRHISVDDLHEETKIPIGLLEAFEETALFDHPQFNRVYLRSFVRTYANVLGIEPDVALEGLEEALSDRYAGSLAVEYLGQDVEARTESQAAPEPEEPEKPQAAERSDAADELRTPTRPKKTTPADQEPAAKDQPSRAGRRGGGRATDAERVSARDETHRRKTSTPDEEQASSPLASTMGGAAAGYEGLQARETDVDETEWTTQSPPRARQTTRRAGYRDRPGGPDWRWFAAVAAIVVVAGVVWVVLSVTGDDPAAEQGMPSAFDTTATAETTTPEDTMTASRAVMPTLGDTMNVQIIAANDKVDPIRVTVDDDLRRPYWLDHGDSMTFRPTNRIVLEEKLESIELSIEGAEYPTNRRDERGRIVITRDSLRAYFRSNGAG